MSENEANGNGGGGSDGNTAAAPDDELVYELAKFMMDQKKKIPPKSYRTSKSIDLRAEKPHAALQREGAKLSLLEEMYVQERSPFCAECSVTDANTLKRCKGCYAVYYCSAECQKKNWTSHHKEQCALLYKMRSEKWCKFIMKRLTIFNCIKPQPPPMTKHVVLTTLDPQKISEYKEYLYKGCGFQEIAVDEEKHDAEVRTLINKVGMISKECCGQPAVIVICNPLLGGVVASVPEPRFGCKHDNYNFHERAFSIKTMEDLERSITDMKREIHGIKALLERSNNDLRVLKRHRKNLGAKLGHTRNEEDEGKD